MRLIIATILIFASAAAAAIDVELSIKHPLTRENGKAITAADIATTTIYAGSAVLITESGLASKVVVDLPTCTASNLTATVTDKSGLESAHSAVLTVELCRPSAPELSGLRAPPAGI